MTTKCDLEEVKHIAQQKFIELVENIDWRYSVEMSTRGAGYFVYADGHYVVVELDWVPVYRSGDNPRNRKLEQAARRAVEIAAARNITQANDDHCRRLQESLGKLPKNTGTTPATTSYDGHTEPYSGSQGHSEDSVWWRRVWSNL